jgi:hypothetical protein
MHCSRGRTVEREGTIDAAFWRGPADDWRGHREDVAEMYVALREDLDDACEAVVEEA